jgi:hypothetical protein
MPNERLSHAMEQMRTMPSVMVRGGKQYTMVKDRIEIFRQEFGDEYGIETTVDYSKGFADGAPVVAHTTIIDPNNRVIASGWAIEFVGSTDITDGSPVEVAETSAIGRALACFGLHGGEYASLNEMESAERKQEFRRDGRNDGRNGRGDNGRNDQRRQPEADERSMVNRRNSDPGLARQVAMNEPQTMGFYVPTDHDAVWLQPEVESNRIIEQIESIGSVHELGRYWSELKPAIDIFKGQQLGLDLIAEIKAAFATRNNFLGGQR